MRKIFTYIFIIGILLGSFSFEVLASPANPNEPCTFDNYVTTVPNNSPCKNENFQPGTNIPLKEGYKLLQPLPQLGDRVDIEDPNALSKYLNIAMKLFIGLCAVLAVVMIVMGGIEYMTSELPETKSDGIGRVQQAILGLLLALGSWVILYQINPDLLNLDLDIKETTLSVNLEEFRIAPEKYIVPLGGTGRASGTNCDENEVARANEISGAGLTNAQIHTLACIGGIESGCKNRENYNWGSGSSAYGPFQILLQGNAGCFESNVCRQAAGVSGPLNCAAGFRGGNPIPGSPIVEQCKRAANNFNCSVSAAACLIKKRPSFGDWNANPNLPKCLR